MNYLTWDECKHLFKMQISSRTWGKYLQTLILSNAEINMENVRIIADLKNASCSVTPETFNRYKTIGDEIGMTNEDCIQGDKFWQHLEKTFNVIISRQVLSKWFSKLGGFNSHRIYKFADIRVIAIRAAQLGERQQKEKELA